MELGHTVTIICHIKSAARVWLWLKQNTGGRLHLVAATDTFYNLTTFEDQSHHFSVKTDKNINRLTISATIWEDVGTYYCGVTYFSEIKFGQGTFLMIKGIHSVNFSY